jgi:hypothetical protein
MRHRAGRPPKEGRNSIECTWDDREDEYVSKYEKNIAICALEAKI